MNARAPQFLASALGQLRYRLALAVIGLGVFMGSLVACVIPLCVYEYYFDAGRALSETFRWAVTGGIFFIAAGLTYHCRGWIIRKALEEAPPEPVGIWPGRVTANAGLAVAHFLALVLASLLSAVIITAVVLIVVGLGYGSYLLLTMLSLPVAIVIGAIIIALAVLIAASR